MAVTGIGPVVRRNGTFKIFIAGSGFSIGDDVTVTFGAITRRGKIKKVDQAGAIALINKDANGNELPKPAPDKIDILDDDDILDITVTVGGTSVIEPGGVTSPSNPKPDPDPVPESPADPIP